MTAARIARADGGGPTTAWLELRLAGACAPSPVPAPGELAVSGSREGRAHRRVPAVGVSDDACRTCFGEQPGRMPEQVVHVPVAALSGCDADLGDDTEPAVQCRRDVADDGAPAVEADEHAVGGARVAEHEVHPPLRLSLPTPDTALVHHAVVERLVARLGEQVTQSGAAQLRRRPELQLRGWRRQLVARQPLEPDPIDLE